jgi:hypothetical protein
METDANGHIVDTAHLLLIRANVKNTCSDFLSHEVHIGAQKTS